MKRFLVFLLTVLSAAGSAIAYTRVTVSDGRSPRWPTMPIAYWINSRGLSQISNGSEFNAVRAAFQTWQDVPSADIRFDYKGVTPVRSAGRDGLNLISFADDTTALGSSTLAATFSFFCTTCASLSTQEADIVFNNSFSWTTSGETGKYDIQSVLTHEIGHLLGLDHSAMISSVMAPFASPNQIDQRVLQFDDIAGVSEIFPRPGSTLTPGQIRGVVMAGGVPVFGAHVVAVDRLGAPVVSTLTLPDGAYTLRFLPEGDYRVYAEPMDLPVNEQNLGGYYRALKTDFGTTYSGNVGRLADARALPVSASGLPSTLDIQVLPKSATSLNLSRPSFGPRIARGVSGTLNVGGVDLSAGASFSSSNSGVVLGAPSFTGSTSTTSPTAATIQVAVAVSAPLGPKNVAVNRGSDGAVLTGGVVVVDVPPSGIAVQPAAGLADVQTRVTITGSNFREGARIYFGGLEAADVHFLDSRTLDGLAPVSTVAGAVNVQVINSDGTNGVAQGAFSYAAPAPSISGVTPLFGPPATPVVIEGERFDPRPQNVAVRFNGAPARVLAATTTSIQVIVPYGATSGPITVSVSGQTVAGPQFAVTPASVSLNTAAPSYKFLDATPASGGVDLAFPSDDDPIDDALALIDLPFTFSLFRDVYLAGSKIAVTTNGFISLESISSAEFQNGPLPGSTVSRPAGGTGVTPSSLIAPFFDDLVMVPGVSTVGVRVIGGMPNRQFVVQWSKMSILDETGVDLNASLTFEVVLFEGSNDIQFVYASLSGPRSDGSSATIGAQDFQRSSAIVAGFNQPIVHSGYVITYRFGDGQYIQSATAVDSTPPSTPLVLDTGAATNNATELAVSWSSNDLESGVAEYEYGIGTSPGAVDVRGFTRTTASAAVATMLNLQSGVSYYVAVRAVNGAGLISAIGVSDGIRLDPGYQAQKKYIAYAPQDASQFSGILLAAPSAMTVTLRAFNSSGDLVSGAGVRNPAILRLAAGQSFVRLVSELFEVAGFDGWIEAEATATGLGVFITTGSWNMNQLDGSAPRELSNDFVADHTGGLLVLANPSARAAAVTMTDYGTAASSSLTIPPRGIARIRLAAAVRIHSSEFLASVESMESGGRLAILPAASVSDARDSFVFPHAVIGAGYSSFLTLTNVGPSVAGVTVSFGSASQSFRLEANSTERLSIADFLELPNVEFAGDAVRVIASPTLFGRPRILASLDISNGVSSLSTDARPASTVISFPYVANGANDLFAGLAIATGDTETNITIEVYAGPGGIPKTATLRLGPNQHFSRLLKELAPDASTRDSGYIRIQSDRPIWALEIYGSDCVLAVAPPL